MYIRSNIKHSTRSNLILIGDVHSRLGNYQETFCFIENESEQKTDQNFERVELPHRFFQDTEKNTSGIFTCHQYNGSSTVDLGVVSWELYGKVQYD